MATSKHLSPIQAIPAYALVANQIQRAVHMGLLVPGDRLPPERALAEQLGVARMTVREAIRVLAHEGHITVRRGARGGMWIRARDTSKQELTHMAADMDRAVGDVYEFRRIIERASAGLAAQRAKPKDVQKLRALTRAMEKLLVEHEKHPLPSHLPKFLALDSQFHSEIARISGNPFVCEAIEKGLAARYTPFGAVFRGGLSPRANKGHDELVDAIAAGDVALAERLMTSHVAAAHDSLVAILNRHVRAQSDERQR